jgi:hypothetical protein
MMPVLQISVLLHKLCTYFKFFLQPASGQKFLVALAFTRCEISTGFPIALKASD